MQNISNASKKNADNSINNSEPDNETEVNNKTSHDTEENDELYNDESENLIQFSKFLQIERQIYKNSKLFQEYNKYS